MTQAFYQAYCEEAYGLITRDMFNKANTTLEGFCLAQLQADLAAL